MLNFESVLPDDDLLDEQADDLLLVEHIQTLSGVPELGQEVFRRGVHREHA
jgi:hypothetical protein